MGNRVVQALADYLSRQSVLFGSQYFGLKFYLESKGCHQNRILAAQNRFFKDVALNVVQSSLVEDEVPRAA